MQAQRTWDGVAYVYEAHSHSRERLEWLKRDLPDGEIRWEPVGLIIPTGPLAGKASGPCYVLWRPLPGVAAPELEDLADLLGPQPPRQPARPMSAPPLTPRAHAKPELRSIADDDPDDGDDNIGNRRLPTDQPGNQRYPAERNGNQRYPAERNGNQRYPAERNGNQRYPAERNGNQRYPAERNGNQRWAASTHDASPDRDLHTAAGRRPPDHERQPIADSRFSGGSNPRDTLHRQPTINSRRGTAQSRPEAAEDRLSAPLRTEAHAGAGRSALPLVHEPPQPSPTDQPDTAGQGPLPSEQVAPQQLDMPIAQQLDAPIGDHPGSALIQQADASEAELGDPEARLFRNGPIRKMPKTTPYKGVTRIDHPKKNMYGFYVRVGWNRQHRSKFFSDKTYGDRDKALEVALTWRNQVEEELGKPHTELQVVGTSRTLTGVIGVRLHYDKHTPYYEASWRDNEGRTMRTRYSILKHGDQRAFELAVSARERGEQARLLQQTDAPKERPAIGKRRRRSDP